MFVYSSIDLFFCCWKVLFLFCFWLIQCIYVYVLDAIWWKSLFFGWSINRSNRNQSHQTKLLMFLHLSFYCIIICCRVFSDIFLSIPANKGKNLLPCLPNWFSFLIYLVNFLVNQKKSPNWNFNFHNLTNFISMFV